MRRYWIEKKYFAEDSVQISGDDFHHICEVCRQTIGDRFEVLNGEGDAFLVEIESRGKKEAVAKILEQRKLPELKKPYIHLVLSIPKFATFETILEKSVELGVREITPVVSEFSFVREVKSEKIAGKPPRWEKIIKSATQQSARADILKLNPVQELKKTLEDFNRQANAAGLFPYEGITPYSVKQAVEHIFLKKPETIWVFIGSEGGFSQKEVELFQSFSLKPSTLGDQVLRVETACLTVVGILRYEIG